MTILSSLEEPECETEEEYFFLHSGHSLSV